MKIFYTVVGLCAAYVIVQQLPELARYLKMKSM